MEIEKKHNFNWDITHKSYPIKKSKNAFWAGYLPFHITEKPLENRIETTGKKKEYSILTDIFLVWKDSRLLLGNAFIIVAIFLLTGYFFIIFESKIREFIFFGD